LHTYEFNNPDTGNLASANVAKHSLMTNAPREQADVRLGYEFYKGARAELEWQLVGPYVTDQANMHDYGGYNLFNLRAEAPINDNITFHAKITNLTNIKYADRATVTTASVAAASKDQYFPGQPLTVFTGVTVKF
jgi:outer membrane cobalamin receptor